MRAHLYGRAESETERKREIRLLTQSAKFDSCLCLLEALPHGACSLARAPPLVNCPLCLSLSRLDMPPPPFMYATARTYSLLSFARSLSPAALLLLLPLHLFPSLSPASPAVPPSPFCSSARGSRSFPRSLAVSSSRDFSLGDNAR